MDAVNGSEQPPSLVKAAGEDGPQRACSANMRRGPVEACMSQRQPYKSLVVIAALGSLRSCNLRQSAS